MACQKPYQSTPKWLNNFSNEQPTQTKTNTAPKGEPYQHPATAVWSKPLGVAALRPLRRALSASLHAALGMEDTKAGATFVDMRNRVPYIP